MTNTCWDYTCGIGIPAARFTLMLLNLVCFLCGLLLVIVSTVIHHRLASVTSLTKDSLLASGSLMAIGWLILLVAYFGFCGAAKPSYCMAITYALMLMTLIVIHIVVAVLLFASVEADWHHLNHLKWSDDDVEMTKASSEDDPRIDRLQSTYECCGMHSFHDWGNNVPDSCCSKGTGPSCVPYEQGCEHVLEGYIRQVAIGIGWVLISLTVLKCIALMMACCLASDI